MRATCDIWSVTVPKIGILIKIFRNIFQIGISHFHVSNEKEIFDEGKFRFDQRQFSSSIKRNNYIQANLVNLKNCLKRLKYSTNKELDVEICFCKSVRVKSLNQKLKSVTESEFIKATIINARIHGLSAAIFRSAGNKANGRGGGGKKIFNAVHTVEAKEPCNAVRSYGLRSAKVEKSSRASTWSWHADNRGFFARRTGGSIVPASISGKSTFNLVKYHFLLFPPLLPLKRVAFGMESSRTEGKKVFGRGERIALCYILSRTFEWKRKTQKKKEKNGKRFEWNGVVLRRREIFLVFVRNICRIFTRSFRSRLWK